MRTRLDILIILAPLLWREIVKPVLIWLLATTALVMMVLSLAGCATTDTLVPPSLLTCTAQPKSPAGKPDITQRDVALYVIDLAAAGDDCRSKLGSVRRILTPENSK